MALRNMMFYNDLHDFPQFGADHPPPHVSAGYLQMDCMEDRRSPPHPQLSQKAVELLNVFFLDEYTRMNPHLLYAQAIPGRTKGRGIGIIDTLHLAEVPLAIRAITSSAAITPSWIWHAIILSALLCPRRWRRTAVFRVSLPARNLTGTLFFNWTI